MLNLLLSIIGIYFFILIGFSAKALFKEKMVESSFTLLSIYFLQPMLVFWGLLQRPIDISLITTPLFYLAVVASVLLILPLLAKLLFKENNHRSILSISAVVGNTGNLGIPIGIALFGEASIPYTTMINLANVFVVYTVGVYFYSRGNFSLKASLLNIVKLPILWFSLLAVLFNLLGITLNEALNSVLEMGAYSSIVIQLVLFGMYLYGVKIEEVPKKLISAVVGVKFLLLPGLTILLLSFTHFDPMLKGVILMELLMPLAVTNVTLASLYSCSPKVVALLIFVTTMLFVPVLFLMREIVEYL
jgi:malate permease and related proteins